MAQSRRFPTPKSLIASSALVVALALTGCQANGAEAPTTATESSDSSSSAPTESATPTPTTPEPTPASAEGPAANIPVPQKPALADKNTKAGLEAFTKWWLELFSYGYVTNDWKTFSDVTDAGCKTCENILGKIRGHYSAGGWVEGGETSLIDFSSKFVKNTAGSINSFADVHQERIIYYGKDGEIIGESAELSPTLFSVIAVYENGRWIMLDFGSPEGT